MACSLTDCILRRTLWNNLLNETSQAWDSNSQLWETGIAPISPNMRKAFDFKAGPISRLHLSLYLFLNIVLDNTASGIIPNCSSLLEFCKFFVFFPLISGVKTSQSKYKYIHVWINIKDISI